MARHCRKAPVYGRRQDRTRQERGGFFYQPFNWRGFYDFGCGALGDMACHILGSPNMALHLSKRKVIAVECIKKEGVSPFMFPKASVIRFDFAPYGNMPALKVFWYDGLKENPKIPGVPEGEWIGDPQSAASRRRGRAGRGPRWTGGAGAPGAAPGARWARGGRPEVPVSDEFRSPGRVFNWDEFAALKASKETSSVSRCRMAVSSLATREC